MCIRDRFNTRKMSLFDEEFYKILVRNNLSFINIYKNYNGFIFYKVKVNNGHQEGDKMAIKVWGIDVSLSLIHI